MMTRCPKCGKVYPPCDGNCVSTDHLIDRMVFEAQAWANERSKTVSEKFYRHTPSGETYAVQVDDAGKITALIGPLLQSEIRLAELDSPNYSTEDAEWANGQEWVDVTPEAQP